MQFPARALLQTPGWAYNRLVMMGWGDPEVALPVVLLGIASCIALFAGIVRWWRGRRGAVTPLILIPPVLSVPFVLLNAPMPRFQGATLWVLPIEMFLVGFSGALAGMPGWVRAGLVVLAVAGTALPLCRSESPFLPLDDFQPVSKSSVAPQELASGFTVYMPLTSHNCFDGPLPCTPEPHPGLRLRRPPDLVGGFVIDDGVEGPPRPATGSGP
jgi:hypothetical protein